MDASISKDEFFRQYVAALDDGTAAVFAGAGLSRSAGFVDWKALLKGFAEELELDLSIEQDLVAVAQYHINANSSDRSRLNQLLVSEFTKFNSPTAGHLALVKMPIKVLHIGLGPIGAGVVRQVASRKGLVIVGAVDLDPAKVGRDLGEVCQVGRKLRVKVTPDIARTIKAAKPDVAVLCTSSSLKKEIGRAHV